MSDYTPTTDFSVKDGLTTGDPEKLLVGQEFDVEFGAIQTAIATKYDSNDFIAATAGTAGSPGFTFSGDLDTGMYRVAADNIGWSTGGSVRLGLADTSFTSLVQILNQVGAQGAPSYSFSGDADTGMFLHSTDGIGLTAGGTRSVFIGTTQMQIDVPVRNVDGTAGAPALSFTSDTDSGLYRIGANNLGFTVGGVNQAGMDGTRIAFEVPIRMTNDGTAAVPAVSFANDTDSGIFRSAADAIGISLGGVLQHDFDNFGITQIGVGAASGFTNRLGFDSGFRAILRSDNHMRVETTRANGNVQLNVPSGGQISMQVAGSTILGLSNAPTTGAQNATFVATNKPGTGTAGPALWLPVIFGGTTYYMPLFGA